MDLLDLMQKKEIAIKNKIAIENKYEEDHSKVILQIENINRDIYIISKGYNLEKINLGKKILSIKGNIYAETDDSDKIGDLAIKDILNNFEILKTQKFYNKKYSGYYQTGICSRSCCPTWGSIWDELELKKEYVKKEITREEKEACIYYIQYLKYNKEK